MRSPRWRLSDQPAGGSRALFFRPRMIEKILTGKKRRATIPVRDGEEHCPFRTGQSYPVRRRVGKPTACRVKVTGHSQMRHDEVSTDGVVREGYGSREDWLEDWRARYGEPGPDALVWILDFELDTEHQPRLLASDSSRGYTTDPSQAMRGEPEAVPEGWKDSGAAERLEEHRKLRLGEEQAKRARSLASRLREVERRVSRAGFDANHMLDQVQQSVDDFEAWAAKQEKEAA